MACVWVIDFFGKLPRASFPRDPTSPYPYVPLFAVSWSITQGFHDAIPKSSKMNENRECEVVLGQPSQSTSSVRQDISLDCYTRYLRGARSDLPILLVSRPLNECDPELPLR